MMTSYYNTTDLPRQTRERYEQSAKAQELRVYDYFLSHPGSEFTPEDIGKAVLPKAPRTSWGRALCNLTKSGLLTKTDRRRVGQYGRPIYYWKLADRKPEQLTLAGERERG